MNLKAVAMSACARMPASCRGQYRRAALVIVDTDVCAIPKMISERARGVVRLIDSTGGLHVGRTEKGAWQRKMTNMERIARIINEYEMRMSDSGDIVAMNSRGEMFVMFA